MKNLRRKCFNELHDEHLKTYKVNFLSFSIPGLQFIGTFLDFTYVDDLCNGLIATFDNNDAFGQTFNLTRGKSIPIENVARHIVNVIGKGKVEIGLSDLDYPSRGTLNINKAKTILGYDPKWEISAGVSKTIESWSS